MTNTFEVNKAISTKLGIEEQPSNTYEAVRAQVDKLGGDLSKVNDIYTGELEVLEHIGGGGGGTEGYDFSELGYSSNTLANYSVQEAIKRSKEFKESWDPDHIPTTSQYILFFPNVDTSKLTSRTSTLFKNAMYIDTADVSGISLDGSSSNNYIASFNNAKNLVAIKKIIFPAGLTSYKQLFLNDSNLVSIPTLDCTGITNLSSVFSGCNSLTSVVLKNTSGVTDIGSMFSGCSSITTIPLFDTSNVTDASVLFSKCSNLTSVPELNLSKVSSFSNVFQGCVSLTTIPLLDTSNATNMNHMFDGCLNLMSIPELNTSKVTDMSYMFQNCENNLTTIPLLDTSNVTRMYYMFSAAYRFTTLPALNTSNVTEMSYMLWSTNVDNLPLLDCTNVWNITNMLERCANLHNVAGFTNLGQAFTRVVTFSLKDSPITAESIDNIINTIYDCTEKTFSPVLELSVNTVVSDEQKAALAAKNWTLTQV